MSLEPREEEFKLFTDLNTSFKFTMKDRNNDEEDSGLELKSLFGKQFFENIKSTIFH